jgi:hypothetical protein
MRSGARGGRWWAISCFSREGRRLRPRFLARFEDTVRLREYPEHPAHLAVIEKLDATTTGCMLVDYEF